MDPSGSSKKKLDGVTNTSGETSYSWTVGQNDSIGRYKVDMQVSASGYENNIASKSFKVTSIPVSSSNSNNDNNNSVQPNSGNSDTNKTIIMIIIITLQLLSQFRIYRFQKFEFRFTYHFTDLLYYP